MKFLSDYVLYVSIKHRITECYSEGELFQYMTGEMIIITVISVSNENFIKSQDLVKSDILSSNIVLLMASITDSNELLTYSDKYYSVFNRNYYISIP